MNPTDFHPIRTALMRSVHDQRFLKMSETPELMSASTPRAPSAWNARFGSRATVVSLREDVWNNWDKMLVQEEMGSLEREVAAASMDRLCQFEDMLASIRRDGHPIVDLSDLAPELHKTSGIGGNIEFERSFTGSMYVHFGDQHGFFCLDNHRRPTGAYVHATNSGRGDIYGNVHLVSTTDDWDRVEATPFYETLHHHQSARVYQYFYDQNGNYEWKMDGRPGRFGSREQAGRLIPLVKFGVDIIAGLKQDLDYENRTEYFYAGPHVAPEHCRIDITVVSNKHEPGLDSSSPAL